jgi:hypothetical protein
MLDFATQGLIDLVAVGRPNFKIPRDLRQVEGGDGHGEGDRYGIAEIHEGMDAQKRVLLSEPSQEGFRSASVPSGLETHSSECFAPRLNFGESGFRVITQTTASNIAEVRCPDRYVARLRNSINTEHTRRKFRKVCTYRVSVGKLHELSLFAGSTP